MTEQSNTPSIGLTGLAVMGRNLARNIAGHGHALAVHNRSPERTRALVEGFGDDVAAQGGRFVPSESLEDFVASIERPARSS